MKPEHAIELNGMSKTYRVYDNPSQRIVEMVTRKPRHRDVPALDNVSFAVGKGQAVGIIGRNGSGKSTLLRILAGIIDPSGGGFEIAGKVSGILELGAGFVPNFSGEDNVILNGRLMGMSEREIREKLPSIVEFSGIGDYSKMAVRTYSSGMMLRLGFAIAQSVEADVFLVDEVLAVGDASFQRKCVDRMNEFIRRGCTIVLVTHSISDLGGFCKRVIQLDRGVVLRDGPTDVVLKEYVEMMRGGDEGAGAIPVDHHSAYRERTREIEIVSVDMVGANGKHIEEISTGDPLEVRIRYNAKTPVTNPMFRIQFITETGVMAHGTNTYRAGIDLGAMEGEGELRVVYDSFDLLEGKYYLTAAIYPDEFGQALADRAYDVKHMAYTIKVKSERNRGAGIAGIPHRWETSAK